MRKKIVLFAAAAMLMAAMSISPWSAETDEAAQTEEIQSEEDASDAEEADADDALEEDASSQDDIVTTKHTAIIQGEEIPYTAQAGTMVLETGGSECEIFFTAYTRDDVDDPSSRPITFVFNGGPGSCSMYLHVGCIGPRRIDVDENGFAKSLPAQMVDNENSLLDLTDLVIIDAVGTGYSRSLEDSDEPFIGYDNDNRTMGDFIRQYISRNNRWGSEKYIAGESYGTPRAVGICEYLADTYAMNLNGLILISSINDCEGVVFASGNEVPYATFIPTYAADAWYHGLLSGSYEEMALEDFLEEVRQFVEDEYVPALFQGNRLSEEEKQALTEKLAGYTGLSEEFIRSSNLRIALDDFCAELLKDQKLMVGRMDGRITGPVTEGSLDDGDSDPSDASFSLSYGNAYNNYLIDELEYQTDTPYIPLNLDINGSWSFPIDNWGGYLNQEQTIYECIAKNPFLKIWVLCGYYDAATPFYSAEWTFNHVFLDDEARNNISFTYYPSGHMIYMEKKSFDQFRKDAEAWFGSN